MIALKNIVSVAKRELIAYFSSPIAYVFVIIFLLLMPFFGFQMNPGFFELNVASLEPFFQYLPWLYLVLVPAIGMSVWAQERRLGTLELLMTMPIAQWHAIVGKFLAAWFVLTLALVLTFPLVIMVNYLGSPDPGPITTGYFGAFLLAGAYLSVATFTSSLTRSQEISLVLSFIGLLLLVILGFDPVLDFLVQSDFIRAIERGTGIDLLEIMRSITITPRFESFISGVLDFRDVLYFLSLIAFFLFCTSVVLREHRS